MHCHALLFGGNRNEKEVGVTWGNPFLMARRVQHVSNAGADCEKNSTIKPWQQQQSKSLHQQLQE